MKNMDLLFMMPTTAFMPGKKKNSSPASQYQTYIHLHVSMDGYM